MTGKRRTRAEVRHHRFRMIEHRVREVRAFWSDDYWLNDPRVQGQCAKRHAFFSCSCTRKRGLCKLHKRKGFEKLRRRRVVPLRVVLAEWWADGQLEDGWTVWV